MSWLFKKRGPEYHWLLDLFEQMGLLGMAEALKLSNCERVNVLNAQKTEKTVISGYGYLTKILPFCLCQQLSSGITQ